MKQGQYFGRSVADVFVWLAQRLLFRLPVMSGIRQRLVGTRFIFTPDLKPQPFA
jgi:hypothetical protein